MKYSPISFARHPQEELSTEPHTALHYYVDVMVNVWYAIK